MDHMTEALLEGAKPSQLGKATLPSEYIAAHLRIEDVKMFAGVADKDVRSSLRVGPVPMPELAPDEVIVAVMASAINYNTIWSAMFEPTAPAPPVISAARPAMRPGMRVRRG